MKRFYYAFLAVLLFVQFGYSQNTLKTMVYNLLEFPSAPPANRELILKDILAEFTPDLLMVNELESEAGADLILNQSLLSQFSGYQRASFAPNQSSSFQNLNQLVFFNTQKLTLIDEELFETTVRDINHYTFRLNTVNQTTNPIILHVYVTHLKADDGTVFDDDQQDRLDMVNVFTNALNLIPSNSFVLFTGDFNFKSASEAAYQEILDPTNNVVLVDPINRPGNWNNNTVFSDIHTQATRISNNNFGNRGAGGGLDDRFDFIMMSQNFQTNPVFFYNSGSYKAFGNNGNCINLNINDPSCTGDFSQSLRDLLFNMSDHLPVVAEFTLTEPLLNLKDATEKSLVTFVSGNLVSDNLKLQFDLNRLPEGSSLAVYNTLGQLMFIRALGAKPELDLPVAALAKGVYFIKLNFGGEVLKFIKR